MFMMWSVCTYTYVEAGNANIMCAIFWQFGNAI